MTGCGDDCTYRALYESSQTSLTDLTMKQTALAGARGRLRKGVTGTLRRWFAATVMEDERAGRRLEDVTDETLLAKLDAYIAMERSTPAVDDETVDELAAALLAAGFAIDPAAPVHTWVGHIQAGAVAPVASPPTSAPLPTTASSVAPGGLADMFGESTAAPAPAESPVAQATPVLGVAAPAPLPAVLSPLAAPVPEASGVAPAPSFYDEAPLPSEPGIDDYDEPLPQLDWSDDDDDDHIDLTAGAAEFEDFVADDAAVVATEVAQGEVVAAPVPPAAFVPSRARTGSETPTADLDDRADADAVTAALADESATAAPVVAAPTFPRIAPSQPALGNSEQGDGHEPGDPRSEPTAAATTTPVADSVDAVDAGASVESPAEEPVDAPAPASMQPVSGAGPVVKRRRRGRTPEGQTSLLDTGAPAPTPASSDSTSDEPAVSTTPTAATAANQTDSQAASSAVPAPSTTAPAQSAAIAGHGGTFKPQIRPASTGKKTRRVPRTKAAAPATPPPAAVPVPAATEASSIDVLNGAVAADKPTFLADLAAAAGGVDAKTAEWEQHHRDSYPHSPFRFIPAKKRYARLGSLVLPVNRGADDGSDGIWNACLGRYSGAKLYELGALLHKVGDSVVDFTLDEHAVTLHLSQSRGLVGVVVLLASSIDAGSDARSLLRERMQALMSERNTLIAVLATTADAPSVIVDALDDDADELGWDPTMPVVVARNWDWISDGGASATLVLGG